MSRRQDFDEKVAKERAHSKCPQTEFCEEAKTLAGKFQFVEKGVERAREENTGASRRR